MLLHIVTLTLIILCEVKSDFISQSTWRDMKNAWIDNPKEYCKNKHCIVKCCPDGHVIVRSKSPGRPKNFSCSPLRVDYSQFNQKITWDDSLRKSNVSYFHFIQNDQLSDLNRDIKPYVKKGFELLKNGSMKYQNNDSSLIIPEFEFCVDFYKSDKNVTVKLVFKMAKDSEIQDRRARDLFIVGGTLISSFFMSLVLLVYALLPNLQNIVGKVLMAYLLSLSVGYTLGAVVKLDIVYKSTFSFSCSDLSPAYYFFVLASFFWLNVMSLDLWWTLRGQRKCREIHRQGELVKFFYYCTYAWGTPLLITVLVVIVDKQKLYGDSKYKPPFENCFHEVFSTRLYLHLPIGIMTFINCVFFAMTVYNIWLIKRGVVTNNESRNTKRQQNRFAIYIKLFIIMGVTWIFEFIITQDWVWHILLNSMQLFSGVFIFYMFVCKKSIILMLCKRFNIQNRFVDRLHSSNYSYTASSKYSQNKSRDSQKSSEKGTELSTLTSEI